jgi:hypothetical protein
MPKFNKKDIIDALKLEMSILEGGGYGRSVRTPWRETTLFRDSITCLNAGETVKQHPCSECFLIDHVPDRQRDEDIPCHHIPLNAAGETIEQLNLRGRREDVEQALLGWIRATIKKLEQEPD